MAFRADEISRIEDAMAALSVIAARAELLADWLAPIHPRPARWLAELLEAALRLKGYLIDLRTLASERQLREWNRRSAGDLNDYR